MFLTFIFIPKRRNPANLCAMTIFIAKLLRGFYRQIISARAHTQPQCMFKSQAHGSVAMAKLKNQQWINIVQWRKGQLYSWTLIVYGLF